ncbi:MAG: OsmC family protein [bacterium]
MQYCLMGLGSCFLSTFAIVCSQLNLNIKNLKLTVKNKLNLSLPLNLGNEPVTKGIEFELEVDTQEDKSKIEEAKNIAINTCPAV